MFRLFSGMAVFAGIVATPLALAPFPARAAPAADYREDFRAQALRTFFDKARCPAREYISEFLDAADRNQLDWRLLPSLAFVESGGGKQAPHNNLFGWESGRARFSSPVAAIHEVAYRLTHSPLYRNKTLDGLLATYNRAAAYARKVKAVMEQIGPAA